MPHPELSRRFQTKVRDEAARLYGIAPSDLAALAAFENFVYECTSEEHGDIVLRISHSSRRTIDYTLGEIEFVRFLAAAGLPVAKPVLTDSGQYVERIDEGSSGGYFVVSAFERAPGHVFDDAPPLKERYWKPPLFRELGRLFARLHSRAESYRPWAERLERQQWYEYDVVDIDRFAPPGEDLVRRRTAEIVDRLKQLPRTSQDYGLIHADLHPHNFCFDGERITVFDFDNCEYAWFVKDIAVVLFYVVRAVPAAERDSAAAAFIRPFLDGYREIRRCDGSWLSAIPDMLALQRSMNYALFHQYRDPGAASNETLDRWHRFRRDIEKATPVVNLDFAGL